MNKVKEYVKKNYLFVVLIVFIIVLIIILVAVRLANQEKLDYIPSYEEVPFDIKIRDANQYNIITVENQDIAMSYYKDWVYLIVNKPEEAYKLLDEKSKEEFDTYEKFEKWIKKYVTAKTKNSTLKGYKYTKDGSKNKIVVSTNERMRYRFIEYSVWNYKVEILGQERNEPVTTKVNLLTTKKK